MSETHLKKPRGASLTQLRGPMARMQQRVVDRTAKESLRGNVTLEIHNEPPASIYRYRVNTTVMRGCTPVVYTSAFADEAALERYVRTMEQTTIGIFTVDNLSRTILDFLQTRE